MIMQVMPLIANNLLHKPEQASAGEFLGAMTDDYARVGIRSRIIAKSRTSLEHTEES
jgi:hypothetical protein